MMILGQWRLSARAMTVLAVLAILLLLAIWRMGQDAQYPSQTGLWWCGQGAVVVTDLVVQETAFDGQLCGRTAPALSGSNAVSYMFRRLPESGSAAIDLARGMVEWQPAGHDGLRRFCISLADADRLTPGDYAVTVYHGRATLTTMAIEITR